MKLDPELLELLICPVSGAALLQDGDTLVSRDPKTRRRYRIEDGIPILLVAEAEEMPQDAWQALMDAQT
ncbi:MAG: hypothetical protein DHS20C21_03330 [Gemmatimonadota bacterium]|nr:MAG: hypothetical protein DHS20C21_03330 [Gemmatimonadota bacterium]